MAPRAIWRGAISFGMVVIPIRVFPATSSKTFSFNSLHAECNSRLKQKRWCPVHDVEVTAKETVRAYEYAKEQYVVIESDDLEALKVPSTHTIDIDKFVSLEEIDPIYFDRNYVLEPETLGIKPFYLLKRAMEWSGLTAVCKVSLRSKEYIASLRPFEDGMLMATMYYPDEVRGNSELELPEEAVELTKEEMAMADSLIGQLTGSFDADSYQDGYREAVNALIESKLNSSEPITSAPAPTQGKVGDLMDALKASIAASKPAAAKTKPKRSAAKKPAANKKATSRKKAPAKS